MFIESCAACECGDVKHWRVAAQLGHGSVFDGERVPSFGQRIDGHAEDGLHICEGFFHGFAIGSEGGEGRCLGDVASVFLAPIDVDGIFHDVILFWFEGVSHVFYVGAFYLARLLLEVDHLPCGTGVNVMRAFGAGELPACLNK